MNKRTLIAGLAVILIALLAYIYFGLIQQNDFYGEIGIPCNDTAEFTYSSNTNILVHTKQKCGDSIRVETKSRRGDWEPLRTTQFGSGPRVKVVNFDTNTVALIEVRRGDKVRFICFNGEFDSCKIEVKNIAEERAFTTYVRERTINCRTRTRTKLYNFTRSLSMAIRINWSSVCGERRGGRFIPTKPKVFEKINDRNVVTEVSASSITRNGNSFRLADHSFGGAPNGGKELLIECPGRVGECRYTILIKGR